MAIRSRVHLLMAERRENIQDLASATGIAYTTAFRLYHDTARRMDYDTLDALCRHFGVTPEKILEYMPDAE